MANQPYPPWHCAKNEVFHHGFFSKFDHMCLKPRIYSYLLMKSLMKNFIFCAVWEKRQGGNRKLFA